MEDMLNLLISLFISIFIISILSTQFSKVMEISGRSSLLSSLNELIEKTRILRYSSYGSFDRVSIFVPHGFNLSFVAKDDKIEIRDASGVTYLEFPGDIIYDVELREGINELELYFGMKEKDEKDKLTLIFK